MKNYNCAERIVFYFAQRSVGKSVPLIVHKVPKPQNLGKMLKELLKGEE